MNPKIFDKVIKKWIGIGIGIDKDLRRNNCAFCLNFSKKDCDECPVFIFTGKRYCENTPYLQWYYRKCHPRKSKIYCEKCLLWAEKVLAYYWSLRHYFVIAINKTSGRIKEE